MSQYPLFINAKLDKTTPVSIADKKLLLALMDRQSENRGGDDNLRMNSLYIHARHPSPTDAVLSLQRRGWVVNEVDLGIRPGRLYRQAQPCFAVA